MGLWLIWSCISLGHIVMNSACNGLSCPQTLFCSRCLLHLALTRFLPPFLQWSLRLGSRGYDIDAPFRNEHSTVSYSTCAFGWSLLLIGYFHRIFFSNLCCWFESKFLIDNMQLVGSCGFIYSVDPCLWLEHLIHYISSTYSLRRP